MDFEGKMISREVSSLLWEKEKTVSTAESCTGGRIAEAIIAVPGASKYFKGGIICYVNEVKENLLGISHQLLEEKTGLPVVLWDERRTSVDAHRILHANGKKMKQHKSTVDAVAASLILEGYLGSGR